MSVMVLAGGVPGWSPPAHGAYGGMGIGMPDRRVFWTADVQEQSCDGTAHEADVCRSGYIDPNWSLTDVGPSREDDAVPDVLADDEADDAGRWLAETVLGRMGRPEISGGSLGDMARWYAADEIVQDGCQVRLAAHAYGFTDAELGRAEKLLD